MASGVIAGRLRSGNGRIYGFMAATDYALHAVVLPFLPRLRALAPGIRVAVEAVESNRSQAQAQAQVRFERGELDLALITPETTPADLHAHHLFDETYVCAVRTGHPDGGTETISLDRFCELDHVLVPLSGQRFRGVTDIALATIGRQRHVVLSVTSFLILSEVLKTTDLIAVIPSRLVKDNSELSLIVTPVSIPGFSKIAVWHDRTHRDLVHQWVRSLLFGSADNA